MSKNEFCTLFVWNTVLNLGGAVRVRAMKVMHRTSIAQVVHGMLWGKMLIDA